MTFLDISNEAARLNALRDLRLLDTPPSEAFDRLTRLASKLLSAPVSTVSLTDGDRQWFKSKVGVDLEEIPRHQAPCSYAIRSDEVFVVPDLLADTRFQGSPLAEAGIRFYAGAPLITRTGFGLGTICVVDDRPREIDAEGRRVLRDLAGMVMAQIDIQNMIGRVDALTGQANEHQLFEDLDDLTVKAGGEPRVAVLVEFVSALQAGHGLRALGAGYAEQVSRACVERLRGAVGNAVRLYQVGPARCLALWDERMARSAEETVELFRRLLAEPVLCNSIPIVLDPALGLFRFKLDNVDGRFILRCLFNAVDDARRMGRGHAAYDEQQDRVHARSFTILNDVAPALKRQDELSLVYQPRIDLRTGRCVGAEALMRWTHPRLGALSPGEFIPLVEQTAFAKPVTDWVLRTAMAQVAAWRAAGVRVPCVSVNASASNLGELDFVARLGAHLQHRRLDPEAIELEFTETALADDRGIVAAQLAAVRALGLDVAIDDFGTGFSSLSYLKHLPASVIKIDRSFVIALDHDERDRKLVRSMIGLAHDLGFRVVAEGIETETVYNVLRDWGCDEGQGYFMAKPMPPAALERWLNSGVQ